MGAGWVLAERPCDGVIAVDLERARRFYRSFHGREPARVVKIPRPSWYRGSGTLVVLGRAGELSYEPFDSSKEGIRYLHEWGDVGTSHNTGRRPWVATDGENVFLIK